MRHLRPRPPVTASTLPSPGVTFSFFWKTQGEQARPSPSAYGGQVISDGFKVCSSGGKGSVELYTRDNSMTWAATFSPPGEGPEAGVGAGVPGRGAVERRAAGGPDSRSPWSCGLLALSPIPGGAAQEGFLEAARRRPPRGSLTASGLRGCVRPLHAWAWVSASAARTGTVSPHSRGSRARCLGPLHSGSSGTTPTGPAVTVIAVPVAAGELGDGEAEDGGSWEAATCRKAEKRQGRGPWRRGRWRGEHPGVLSSGGT